MGLKFDEICIDAADPTPLGQWWSQALGWPHDVDDEGDVVLHPPGGAGPEWVFLRVDDRRIVKNRIHFDFRPDDQHAEVERLLALGARHVDIGQGEQSWVVLADPEGNEVASQPAWLADTLRQIEREFLAGPPLTLHLPVPELFAAVWAAVRESALSGPMDRAVRESIASSVSLINKCPFCVDSHTAAASALGADAAAKAVRSGDLNSIERDDVRHAARWAAATRRPGDPRLRDPAIPLDDFPYAVGTALFFHYVNRMVSTFLKPWPIPLPTFVSRRPFITRVNALFPGRLLGAPNLEPGDSLRFVKEAPLPPELRKLQAAPEVAVAWGALCVAAEQCGERTLSTHVRTAVGELVDAWDGTDPGLGWRAPDEGPGARFALTVALAAYKVDDALVATTRRSHPTDAELVSVAAWASMRATRRIASWL
jgi:AhpD family alkylhydroperoxidase